MRMSGKWLTGATTTRPWYKTPRQLRLVANRLEARKKTNTPPPTGFQADYLDKGESVYTPRGAILPNSSFWLFMCTPRDKKKTDSETRPEWVCYLAIFSWERLLLPCIKRCATQPYIRPTD